MTFRNGSTVASWPGLTMCESDHCTDAVEGFHRNEGNTTGVSIYW